jgi:hypothetical protein
MEPLRIYLAGKISKYDWRTTIVDGMGTPCGIDVGAYYDYVNEETRYPKSWEPYEQSIHGVHTYTGPYFLRCDHGCYHGENEHGSGIESYGCGCGSSTFASDHKAIASLPRRREHIVHLCLSAIDTSDVVFAWIENTTCYGTLAEIGYAHGAGKTIWIAGPSHFPDLWFTYQLARPDPVQSHLYAQRSIQSLSARSTEQR